MKNTIYVPDPKQPYGLHDRRITYMEICQNNLELFFEDGYTKLSDDYPNVNGSVLLEGVDFDFASIYLGSKFGEYGEFKSKKMSLQKFRKKYKKYEFEIVDEYFGWHKMQLAGYIWIKGKKYNREAILSIGYFTGNIVYKTGENDEADL